MWGGIRIERRQIRRAALVAALLAVAVVVLDAFWWEPASIAVVHHTIRLSRGTGLNGLRIAVISDLHAGSRFIDDAKIAKIVRLTNAEHPDLVLLLGDYVQSAPSRQPRVPITRIAPLLKPLHARLGVYALIGNHDRWADAPLTVREMEKAGFMVMENRAVIIFGDKWRFVLAGIGDDYTHAANPQKALAGTPPAWPAICATHSPDVFPRLPAQCVLTIAGHTHGGQVDLPLLGRLVVPSRFGSRYAAGLVREFGRTLFVSTGIGTSIMPVRFRVPPEVSLLEVDVDA